MGELAGENRLDYQVVLILAIKDYYQLLGVERESSVEQIKKAHV
jgi:hypothetical protein